jgi:1,2-diacylglycerol 3-alpha-glucosyltransferase
MKKESVLFIWDRIGDYHYARVKACEEVLGQDVYTADLAGTDALYKWNSIAKPRHTVLSAKPAEQPDFTNRFRAFRAIIKKHSITTVAMPYGRSEYHAFLLYARLKGIRTIIFSESWYSRGFIKDTLKSILLKVLGNHFFVSGEHAFNHFTKNYNIHPNKIETGYSVVDNKHFHRKIFTGKKYIICPARYSEEKNLSFLIRCYAKSSIRGTYTLRLIGEGPLRSRLQEEINALGLTENVQLTGWVSYEDLPKEYAGAALFVLPSKFEPWGLVVNEAMSAGLPIIISDTCGCKPDLLSEGANGWSINPENEDAFVERLNKFNTFEEKAVEILGKNSLQLIRSYSPETWAKSIQKIVNG